MRTLLWLSLLALVASACGDDDDIASPTTSTTTSTTSTTSVTSSTAGAPPSELPELEQTCESPEGFTISYPADWEAVSDCGQFGPAPIDEPEPGTDERTGVVSAYVDAVPFGEVSGDISGEDTAAVTVVDGLQALRVESQTTGEGLYPAGTGEVTWMIDLSVGPDDGPGTLFVHAVDVVADVEFERAVPIMDAMARSLDVQAGDEPDDDQIVARYEGGGAPFVVAAAPSASTPETCLRLLDAEEAIACVEPVDAADGVSLTGLETSGDPITVGITGSEIFAVELDAGDESLRFLPVPYPGRDSRGLAVPFDAAQIESVTLRSIDGAVIGRTSGPGAG